MMRVPSFSHLLLHQSVLSLSLSLSSRCFPGLSSQLSVLSSQFSVLSPQFSVHGSQLSVLGLAWSLGHIWDKPMAAYALCGCGITPW